MPPIVVALFVGFVIILPFVIALRLVVGSGMASDPLASLRCPKGCSTRFINYLIYEGTDLRVVECHASWGSVATYDIGLRCGDCGWRYGKKDIPEKVKNQLDKHLEGVASVLEEFLGQEDDRLLREAIDALPRMIEGNR